MASVDRRASFGRTAISLVLAGTTAALSVDCSQPEKPRTPVPQATSAPKPKASPEITLTTQPQFVPSEKPSSATVRESTKPIVQEVTRVVKANYAPESAIYQLYLGGGRVESLSMFRLSGLAELPVGGERNSGFYRGTARISSRRVFSLVSNNQKEEHPVVLEQNTAIGLSANWLNCPDEVRTLVLEKEIGYILHWHGFRDYNSGLFERLGAKTSPLPGEQVTQEQIDNTMALSTLSQAPNAAKLFYYLPYLALLPKVEALLEQDHDPKLRASLELFGFVSMLELAKEAGVPYASLDPNSPEFIEEGLNTTRIWASSIISNPRLQGPPTNLPVMPGPKPIGPTQA